MFDLEVHEDSRVCQA